MLPVALQQLAVGVDDLGIASEQGAKDRCGHRCAHEEANGDRNKNDDGDDDDTNHEGSLPRNDRDGLDPRLLVGAAEV